MYHHLVEITGVVVATLATVAAFWAASEARRAAQSQLVVSLVTHYASRDMLEAIVKAKAWDGKERILEGGEFDVARRVVSHHYQHIASLGEAGFLSRKLLHIVTTQEGVAFFWDVIQPMERHINSEYNRRPFEYLASLYGGEAKLRRMLPRGSGAVQE